MRSTLILITALFLASLLGSCAKSSTPTSAHLPSIQWDQSTRRLISEKGDLSWNGYARLIQLKDHSLFAVYFNSGKGIMGVRSSDRGNTWDAPFLILPNSATHNMDNPEIVQLKDGGLLISTNLRPIRVQNNQDATRRFQIGVIKSTDNGKSWSPLKILYSATWKFTDGCWEPKAIQLPSGEIQVYFSNEAPYPDSSEQNISMLSSEDGGQTWTTEPVIVSFRANYRDGMPAPVLLKDAAEIVMPIEDNTAGLLSRFKISIIRGPLADGWKEPVSGSSPRREYALANILPASGPYAGAPYLAQLPSGETILSYQSMAGREGSPDTIDAAVAYVAVGDAQARNFQNASAPFDIPPGKSGLWTSVAALDNGEILLLTSTNGLSTDEKTEVWLIKGRLTR